MADLSCTIAGIPSPNPFWVASAPPSDKYYNVDRAFRAGWGWSGLENFGDRPADRQRHFTLRQRESERTEDDGAQ